MCVGLLGLAMGCNGVQDQIADTTALAAQIVDVWI